MFNLKDKTIVVTGASSGIGRACAILCAKSGAKVALVGRDENRLRQTAESISNKEVRIYKQELTEYGEIPEMVESIVKDLGLISGFVHAAGIETVLPLKLTTPSHFEKAFAVNVIAAFELIKAIIKKKNVNPDGASMVLISSVMGVVGQPTKTVYSATKGALIAGTRSLALELARSRIRVNCVSPGMVKTGMSEALLEKVTPEAMDSILKAHPLGIGTADDVANACLFLLSDQARWITGTNLIVDGGYTAQ